MAYPRPPSSPINAVFDYQDFESGINYKSFYAMTSSLAAGAEFILSDTVELSATIESNLTNPGTLTLTFDSSPFNFQRTIKGSAIFTVGVSTDGTTEPIITVQLKKYDGSTATNISSVITSAQYLFPGGVADTEFLLRLPITETNIAEGELLRLVVTMQTFDNSNVNIGHDPAGRTGAIVRTVGTSVMKLNVPFKIE